MSKLYKRFTTEKRIAIFLCVLFGLFIFLVFYVFSVFVKHEIFSQMNFDFTVKLQGNIPERFDEIIEEVAFFVSPFISIFLVGLLTLYAGIDIRKKMIYPGALLIPLFFALMIGIEIFGKVRVESPGPPFFMIKNPTTIFPTYFVQEAYSYPSGHAARALFIFGTFCLVSFRSWNKKVVAILVAALSGIILTISLGKVHLGHHWLSDIIGGWIIASAFLVLLVPFLFYGIRINTIKKFMSASVQDNSKTA
jgi:undecaprenyl-diphosphatase